MTKADVHSSEEVARHECYALLNSAEFNERISVLPVGERETILLRSHLKILIGGGAEEVYPGFQLDARLNDFLLSSVRELYRLAALSDVFVWDFLRTRHKLLDGKTGVDFLLGYFSVEIAAMPAEEREDHFRELIHEEIGRLSQ